MRSKRLLSLLLVVCLLVSVVAPSATAVTNNAASIITDKKANTQDASNKQNSLLISGEKSNTISTLRDQNASAKPEANTTSTQKGSWTATPSDTVPSVDTPHCPAPQPHCRAAGGKQDLCRRSGGFRLRCHGRRTPDPVLRLHWRCTR